MGSPENNLISIQVSKELTSLYKDFLEIIEDLQKDHDILIQKIKEKNGDDYAKDINFFTQSKYDQIRKRVLDKGNNQTRNILNFLDFYDFQINTFKLEAAANKRQVVRRFKTSSSIMYENNHSE